MDLIGKTVVLTGAAGGMGREIAEALDAEGARLLLVDINESAVNALASRLQGNHATAAVDLTAEDGRTALLAQCQKVGPVDVLINAAGMSEFTLFEKQNVARLEKMTMINLVVPMLLCHSLLPMLKERPEAAIVNIGSTFGSIGHPGFATYCANKFGLRGFTEALRRELSDLPLRILYLAPRATRTDMNSAAVNGLNEELGNTVDDPEVVVKSLLSLLESGTNTPRFIGWPEKLFVRLNGLAPGIIDRAMRSRLPVIRRYAG